LPAESDTLTTALEAWAGSSVGNGRGTSPAQAALQSCTRSGRDRPGFGTLGTLANRPLVARVPRSGCCHRALRRNGVTPFVPKRATTENWAVVAGLRWSPLVRAHRPETEGDANCTGRHASAHAGAPAPFASWIHADQTARVAGERTIRALVHRRVDMRTSTMSRAGRPQGPQCHMKWKSPATHRRYTSLRVFSTTTPLAYEHAGFTQHLTRGARPAGDQGRFISCAAMPRPPMAGGTLRSAVTWS